MKKTYFVVLLDYSAPTVNYYKVEINATKDIDDSELIESWLAMNTEHHLSNCSWMADTEEIEVLNHY